MKRFSKTLVAVMVVAATGAAILVGCKKEENAQMKNGVGQAEQGMSPEEQKVLDFLANYEAMKNGVKTEGEPVDLEEARWYWETTLNYRHGFTQSQLIDVRQDVIRIPLPKVDAQGDVSYSDLLDTYDIIIDEVRDAYKAIDMEGKTLQFVMMSIESSASKDGEDSVVIIMNTGRDNSDTRTIDPGPWYGVPFRYGECWIWGDSLGPCGDWNPAIYTYDPYTSDAAQEQDRNILKYDYNNTPLTIPDPNLVMFIENPYVLFTLTGSPNNDSLFYASGLSESQADNYCLCYQYLNKEYAYIMRHTHYEGMPIVMMNEDWYYKVEVKAVHPDPINNIHTIYHEAKRYNCTRRWKYKWEIPVPIEDPQY